NTVGRCAFVQIGADQHYPNLFATLVAPSGVGKGEPWGVTQSLLASTDAGWKADAITYGLGSGEGLIERLQASEKRWFVHEAEFGAVLPRARRDGSTLTPTLCNAWDGRPLEVANRGKAKLRADEHHVSIWANITTAELTERLGRGLEAVN